MKKLQLKNDDYLGRVDHLRHAGRGILVKDGNVLLCYEANDDKYLIPGGGLEAGETLEQCCERELLEETGMEVQAGENFLDIDELFLDWRHVCHYFECQLVRDTGSLRLTQREASAGCTFVWKPLPEALEIFSCYEDFHETNIADYGLYRREYFALREYCAFKKNVEVLARFAEPYLSRLVTAFRQIIGDRLLGVYLHGSAAMGCFNPQTSDLDVLVGVSQNLDGACKRRCMDAVVGLHEAFVKERENTHAGIEMSVVTKAACNPFVYPTPFDLHFSAMHLDWYKKNPEDYVLKMNGSDKDLAAHCMIAKKRGRCLYGMPVDEFLGDVPADAYLDSIMEDVADAENEIAGNMAYVVLNLARVLAYKREGLVLSKLEGGQWALRNLQEEYHNLLDSALQEYAGENPWKEKCADVNLAKRYAGFMLRAIHES